MFLKDCLPQLISETFDQNLQKIAIKNPHATTVYFLSHLLTFSKKFKSNIFI
jgi:hypothetical protein